MPEEFKKERKFVVLTLRDVAKYLDINDQSSLSNICAKVTKGRLADGKPENNYIVCNEDEQYAEKIWQEIANGEAKKHQGDFRGNSS